MKIMEFFVNHPSITNVYVQLNRSFAYVSRNVDGWSYLMRSLDLYDYDVISIDPRKQIALLRKKEV